MKQPLEVNESKSREAGIELAGMLHDIFVMWREVWVMAS